MLSEIPSGPEAFLFLCPFAVTNYQLDILWLFGSLPRFFLLCRKDGIGFSALLLVSVQLAQPYFRLTSGSSFLEYSGPLDASTSSNAAWRVLSEEFHVLVV